MSSWSASEWGSHTARALIDLAVLRRNLRAVRSQCPHSRLMAMRGFHRTSQKGRFPVDKSVMRRQRVA